MNRTNNIVPRWAAICLILAAITGCSKNSISPSGSLADGLDPSSGSPIAFEAEDAFTKADGETDEKAFLAVRAGGFKVWSWFEGTTPGPMFGEKGTHVKDDNYDADLLPEEQTSTPNWTYSPIRYWINGTYDFAAVYPATITTISYRPSNESVAPVLTIPTFDVKKDGDLLAAFSNNIDGANRTGNNPVKFGFQHKLTKVNIKISQDEDDPDNDYYVTRVEISGVKNKKTYTATPMLDEDGDIISLIEKWETSADEELMSAEQIFNPPIRLRDPGLQDPFIELSVWPDDSPLLLVPQNVDGTTMKVRIEYTYDMSGEEDGAGMATFVLKEIPATDPEDELWKPGRQITYKIALSQQTGINFDIPKIEPWSQPLTGGTIIIE